MKALYPFLAVVLFLLPSLLPAQNGILDTSFGNAGFATDVWKMNPKAMAVQADGGIVLAGWTFDPGVATFLINRFFPDGQVDTTFGNKGHIYFGASPYDNSATCVAIQPDGKIVVGGTSLAGPSGDFVVIRLLPTGDLDSTFNGTGFKRIDFGNSNDEAYAILIQPDGKIILAGGVKVANAFSFGAVRLAQDGSLDLSFNATGKFTYKFPATVNKANAMCFQPDGKIILAGQAGPDLGLLRLNPDGTLDQGFGTNGVVVTASGKINAMMLQPDDKIVVAGNSATGKFLVARFDDTGSPDGNFGVDGISVLNIQGSVTAIDLQPDGRILMVGTSMSNVTVIKCDPDGSLNPDFGNAGIAVAGSMTNNNVAVKYIEPQKILVGGTINGYPLIMRFSTVLDSVFVVSTQEQQLEKLQFKLYPNPASIDINLQYFLPQDSKVTVQLLDSQGEVIQVFLQSAPHKTGLITEHFNLKPSLPKGNYIVSINNGWISVVLQIL